MFCPICDEELDRTYSDYLDGWLEMESEYSCSNNHYVRFWSAGSYEETAYGRIIQESDGEKVSSYFFRKLWLLIYRIYWRLNGRNTQ